MIHGKEKLLDHTEPQLPRVNSRMVGMCWPLGTPPCRYDLSTTVRCYLPAANERLIRAPRALRLFATEVGTAATRFLEVYPACCYRLCN